MQILSLLGIGKTLTKIVAALYRSIASIYTDMTELVNTFTQGQFADTLNKVVGNVYTLVGVFMLFRIGVSLLNYLVDPSKLDDKKVGGGQLVTHILISIVLLLSLKFVFVWTNELQGHLLESGGILDNIIKTGNAEVSKLNNISLADNTEVSVASKKYLADESVEQRCENVSSDVIKTLQKFINESCPHSSITISESNISSRLADYAQRDNIVGGNKILEYMDVYLKLDNGGTKKITSLKEKGTINYATKTYEYKCLMSAIGGSSRAEDIEVTSQSKFIVDYYCTPKTIDTIEQNTYNYINSQYDLPNVSADGLNFSIITLSAFVSPSNELNETFLTKYEGDYSSDWWAEKIEDEVSEGKVYSMDWLMAIICGLAIIVVLLAIMIEVVVRNLKLVILQAIAPIPIVSYMNPNDKMLGNWVKQYVGVYFSLFLQLLAITLIPKLMMSLLQSITGGFILKIIIIAGCLLFTKEAPKFIGKLLGLENMSGSFGDAFKMVKTGLGIGAGAAAGAVAGAVTGFGAGGSASTVMGGLLGGAFRGASGGAKGKVFDGAKTQIGRNQKVRDMNLNGSTWGQRMLSKVGLDKASRSKGDLSELQAYQKKYNDFTQHKKNIEDLADSSDFMTNLRNERNADGSQKYTAEQLKAARTDWINAQQDIANGKIPSNIIVGNNRYGVVEEKGKWSGIETELKVAEAERNNSGLLQKLSSGANPIKDFSSLDAIDKDVKKANNDVKIKIAEIVSDPTHIAAEASKNSK